MRFPGAEDEPDIIGSATDPRDEPEAPDATGSADEPS
jgi:hypothetical protein